MGSHDEDLHPLAKGLLAALTVVLVCVGAALLVFGLWVRSVPTFAIGVACICGAVITRPT
jgi:hypothetical protein